MKRKLGLELYGPCSNTGAEPTRWGTIATIDENGRVNLSTVVSVQRESQGAFVALTMDGESYLASECYLLYTVDPISTMGSKVKNLLKRN